jgi:hypothetical protein
VVNLSTVEWEKAYNGPHFIFEEGGASFIYAHDEERIGHSFSYLTVVYGVRCKEYATKRRSITGWPSYDPGA